MWSGWREIPAVCFRPAHLKRTVAVALVVGTILFLINQFDVVITGHATATTWLKAAFTYLVPFAVANYGLLVANRRRKP